MFEWHDFFLNESIYFIAISVCIAGLIRGFAGFGAAMAMIPLLSLAIGPEKAVLLVSCIEIIGSVQLLPEAIKNTSFFHLKLLSLSAIISVPIGVYILTILEPEIIITLMSIVVLSFVLAMFLGWKNQNGYTSNGMLIAGGISGFLAGSTGMAGPPIILYMISPEKLNPNVARGTLITYFAITGIATFLFLLYMGKNPLSTIGAYIIILTPLFLISTYFGTLFFQKSGLKHYKKVALILLSIISIYTLVKSYIV
ncbi:sulfite exporter TauE/SafE family protein [Thiothrix nivea]|uniref:Probable membrane transporter protein n=1 Tax=Thiothrix nivea (strain ATCC 35100 / DSM 5205 / JP2) TaxID=870187 RepID=A0A656HJ04_THINJ|nr:sulfite exporter TauE/SafE family protein [Thiothrix nivea]EIJ36951.1 protein of unknown function DUF81 [Thiothrix nivea DSM 5205]